MASTPRARILSRLRDITIIVLLLLVVGALAWLSHAYKTQFDWTYGSRNTLSDASRELLAGLQGPVTLTAFIQDKPDLRTAMQRRIERYQRVKDDVELDFANPARERAREGSTAHRAGQVRVTYQMRSEIIDQFSEQAIFNALKRATRQTDRWVVFLQGQHERQPRDDSNQGLSRLTDSLERSGFHIQALNLVQSLAIPDNTTLLVIAAPKDALPGGELKLIAQYLNNGGNLLWLHDPNHPTALENVADALGIRFVKGAMVDTNTRLRRLLGIRHPAVVPVIQYPAHAITQGLDVQTLFPFVDGMRIDQRPDWQATPILKSSAQSWSETGSMLGKEVTFRSKDGDIAGPLPMGVALEHQSDQGTQRAVVVGDSDFLANGYIGHGGNLQFATNIFNWLSRDESLIDLPLRVAPDRRLDLDTPAIIGLGLGFLLVLPLALLVTGMIIWAVRRRR